MQLRNLFIMMATCLLPGVVMAATPARLPVQAAITGVTVYPDRAQVTRTATLQLKPGSQIVVLEGLPVLLQDDSVRVAAKGAAQTTITGLEVKRSFLSQTADKRVQEIEAELKLLERKLGALDAKKAGLTAQRSFVDSIKVAWGERISHLLAVGKPMVAELHEVMGFVGGSTVKTEEQQQDLEQQKQVIRDQMDALKRQRQEAGGSQRKEAKTVEVALETAKAGSLTLELSGVVGQATWEPGYDVRLSADGSNAELIYRAQVRQQTGEDWKDVRLTLSTARPASGGAPPVLHPWRVALYRPMPLAMPAAVPRTYKKAVRMEMADAMLEPPAPEAAAPAAFQTAQAASEGTAVVFMIPKPVAISSDNTRHSTVIAIEQLPVNTEYIAIPKLSPAVYLTAELVNKASWPLLPGTVKIFSGNTFVGSAEMTQVASGEKFSLPFGSDEQVVVKREELKQHKAGGMFGKSRMGYRSTLTVTNFRKEAQIISIKDQLPLAGDSEITVSLDDVSVPPTTKQDDGTLIWKLKLAPGEKKELRYEVVVEYPKDREVSGL